MSRERMLAPPISTVGTRMRTIPPTRRDCPEHRPGVRPQGSHVPRTTTELARQLGRTPGAVSAHLSRLKAAGLVEPYRSGRRVYYRLSCAGESLLGIFGET